MVLKYRILSAWRMRAEYTELPAVQSGCEVSWTRARRDCCGINEFGPGNLHPGPRGNELPSVHLLRTGQYTAEPRAFRSMR